MHFVSNELVREFTSVYECWADCLNQDLLDFLDFQDVACLAARTLLDERLREMYESLREFAGCLNQDLLDSLDLQDAACLAARTWLDERLREMYVRLRKFTRVCESLRVVWTAVLVNCVMGCD